MTNIEVGVRRVMEAMTELTGRVVRDGILAQTGAAFSLVLIWDPRQVTGGKKKGGGTHLFWEDLVVALLVEIGGFIG